MSKSKIDSVNIQGNKVEISVSVIVYYDKEDKVWYGEVPSLDISSYGDTKEDANRMVLEAVAINLEYMLNNNTLEKQLEKGGWSKNPLVEDNYLNSLKQKKHRHASYDVYQDQIEA